MRRRKFLSLVLGGVAGWLPLAARGAAPEQSYRGPEGAARSTQTPDYWEPLRPLTLADGREVHVQEVVACRTYLGLLAGRPNDEINEQELGQLKQFCKRAFVVEDSIIIPAVMIPRGFGGEIWNEYPPMFVAALFRSVGGARHKHGDFSELSVGWFQSSLQPLIPDDTLAAIRNLDWTNLAHDGWL